MRVRIVIEVDDGEVGTIAECVYHQTNNTERADCLAQVWIMAEWRMRDLLSLVESLSIHHGFPCEAEERETLDQIIGLLESRL